MDDRTLDEFLGAPSGEESGEDADASTDRSERSVGAERDDGDRPERDSDGGETDETEKVEAAGQTGATDQSAGTEVTPAAPTYRWAPDGAPCARCGTTVQRRWVDDGDAVCANCKEW